MFVATKQNKQPNIVNRPFLKSVNLLHCLTVSLHFINVQRQILLTTDIPYINKQQRKVVRYSSAHSRVFLQSPTTAE